MSWKNSLQIVQELRNELELTKQYLQIEQDKNKQLEEDSINLHAEISRWRHGSVKALVNIQKKAKERFIVNLDTLYPNLHGNIYQLVWDSIEHYTAMSKEDWTS